MKYVRTIAMVAFASVCFAASAAPFSQGPAQGFTAMGPGIYGKVDARIVAAGPGVYSPSQA